MNTKKTYAAPIAARVECQAATPICTSGVLSLPVAGDETLDDGNDMLSKEHDFGLWEE